MTISPERLYATAYEALSADDDTLAQQTFFQMALVTPSDERAWIGLAVCRERARDMKRAAALYEVGLAFNPRSGWCHFGLGRTLSALGRHGEAAVAFAKAGDVSDEDSALQRALEERI